MARGIRDGSIGDSTGRGRHRVYLGKPSVTVRVLCVAAVVLVLCIDYVQGGWLDVALGLPWIAGGYVLGRSCAAKETP